MRSALRLGCILALWVLVLPGLAGAQPWTAVGSSGVVDPAGNPSPIHTLAGPFLQYGVVSNAPIIAYYNVTAVAGATPPWLFMGMNAVVTGGGGATVDAALYQSLRCGTGMPQAICKITTSATGCFGCFLPGPLDFNLYEYYVLVTLQRSASATGWPALRSLLLE